MGVGKEQEDIGVVGRGSHAAAEVTTPPPARRAPHDSSGWGNSLLGCFREPAHAALCLLCSGCGSAYTFGATRKMLDNSNRTCTESCVFCLACCAGVSCMMGYANRVKLRARYGIPGSECQDFAAHFCCCQSCALIQEYRYVKDHGAPVEALGCDSATQPPPMTSAF